MAINSVKIHINVFGFYAPRRVNRIPFRFLPLISHLFALSPPRLLSLPSCQKTLYFCPMSKSAKQKYYVVWRGFKPGIYSSWEMCRKQITGYENAQYKSFASLEEARQAFEKSYVEIMELKGKKDLHALTTGRKPILNSLSVDAACKGNPGILEYRGVYTDTQTEVFRRGPYAEGTVNIGEFLAIVLALAWLKKNKLQMPIYSDSRTAIAWIRKKQVNTKLKWSEKNRELLRAVNSARQWLKENDYGNIPILKWETDIWGEIPADYGRK